MLTNFICTWYTSLNRDITSRTFSLPEFLAKHRKDLTPAGLCFFQATWDNSVTQTFMETLGKTVKYMYHVLQVNQGFPSEWVASYVDHSLNCRKPVSKNLKITNKPKEWDSKKA